MSDWSVADATLLVEDDETTKNGRTMTSGAANTKGSYVEIVASLSVDATAMYFAVSNQPLNNGNFQFLIDIATGAGGSEQVIVSNYPVWPGTALGNVWCRAFMPISIPAGTRVATRCQASGASKVIGDSTNGVKMHFLAGGWQDIFGGSLATTVGSDVTTSGGTVLTSGNNAFGLYSQLTASLSADISWVVLCVGAQTTTQVNIRVTVAVGAGGSEQAIMPEMNASAQNGDNATKAWSLPMRIPAGTRIAAKTRTEANSTPIQVIIIGVE